LGHRSAIMPSIAGVLILSGQFLRRCCTG
jgi:hypothetical protein